MNFWLFRSIVWIFFHVAYAANSTQESQGIKTGNSENTTDTSSVTLYTLDNFWGIPWALSVSNCTGVPAYFYKKTSSINTHGSCVILFSREDCQGRWVQIAPGTTGHSHLSQVNFDDTLVSLKPCKTMDSASPGSSEVSNSNELGRSRREAEVPFLSELMKRLGISGSSNDEDNGNDDENNNNDDENNNNDDENNNDAQDPEDSQETGNKGLMILQALFPSLKIDNENGGDRK